MEYLKEILKDTKAKYEQINQILTKRRITFQERDRVITLLDEINFDTSLVLEQLRKNEQINERAKIRSNRLS